MHPLYEIMFNELKKPKAEPNKIILAWAKERAEWLKQQGRKQSTTNWRLGITDKSVDQAFQLTTQVCDKCGQIIKEPQ